MSKNRNKKVVLRPDVSVIIPVYGHLDALDNDIKAAKSAADNLNLEFILVDDVSPDLKPEIYRELQAKHPEIKHIKYRKKNGGYGAAVNDGAKLALAPTLLVHSTDVVLQPSAIKIMHEQLTNNDDIGVTFPMLLFFPNSKDMGRPAGKIQAAGVCFDFDQNPLHIFVGWEPTHPFANRVKDFNAFTGAVFLIKTQLFRQIGGFDEGYGRGTWEDMALSMEVRMRNFKCRYLPQAKGFHYVGASAERYNVPFPVNENSLRFKQKYGKIIPYDYFLYAGQ